MGAHRSDPPQPGFFSWPYRDAQAGWLDGVEVSRSNRGPDPRHNDSKETDLTAPHGLLARFLLQQLGGSLDAKQRAQLTEVVRSL